MTQHFILFAGPSHSSAKAFVDYVIDFARQQGLDQNCLAERAAISPESLSRLKKTGRCRLSTAFELAKAAGLQKIEVTGPSGEHGAATMAVHKLSAGRRRAITVEEFLAALATGVYRENHQGHLLGFFEELPIECVHDVIIEEKVDCERLFILAKKLGAEGETVEWLEEMACDGMAKIT